MSLGENIRYKRVFMCITAQIMPLYTGNETEKVEIGNFVETLSVYNIDMFVSMMSNVLMTIISVL